jgi:hypothetical protein
VVEAGKSNLARARRGAVLIACEFGGMRNEHQVPRTPLLFQESNHSNVLKNIRMTAVGSMGASAVPQAKQASRSSRDACNFQTSSVT